MNHGAHKIKYVWVCLCKICINRYVCTETAYNVIVFVLYNTWWGLLRVITYVRHLLASVWLCNFDILLCFYWLISLWFLWHFGRISVFKFLWLLVIIWCENWLSRMLRKVAYKYILNKFFFSFFRLQLNILTATCRKSS